jgi:hypothetical protein
MTTTLLSVQQLFSILEDAYCDNKTINITNDSKRGSLSFNANDLEFNQTGDWLYFEDMRDSMVKIKVDCIKKIYLLDNEFADEIRIEFNKDEYITMLIM